MNVRTVCLFFIAIDVKSVPRMDHMLMILFFLIKIHNIMFKNWRVASGIIAVWCRRWKRHYLTSIGRRGRLGARERLGSVGGRHGGSGEKLMAVVNFVPAPAGFYGQSVRRCAPSSTLNVSECVTKLVHNYRRKLVRREISRQMVLMLEVDGRSKLREDSEGDEGGYESQQTSQNCTIYIHQPGRGR